MRNSRKLVLFLFLAVAVGALTGCASLTGEKQAATPADQAVLVAGKAVLAADKQMHEIRVDHGETAAKYFKGCTAATRTIDQPTCNAWDAFDGVFRIRYREAGNQLEFVKGMALGPSRDTAQGAVDAAISRLRSDLNQKMR